MHQRDDGRLDLIITIERGDERLPGILVEHEIGPVSEHHLRSFPATFGFHKARTVALGRAMGTAGSS